MAEGVTESAIRKMLARLPGEHDAYEDVRRRVRLKTVDGRTFYAFVRAGAGKLSFAGWEQTTETKPEDEWQYFVVGAEKPGAPLHLISQHGLIGVVVEAELEDRDS